MSKNKDQHEKYGRKDDDNHESGHGGKDKIHVLVGTNGNNILTGTAGKDVILGKKGDDQIDGGAGNDFLFGGKGNDLLFGGAGRDFLFGDKGNDLVDGGAGNDRVLGGKGNDTANYTWSENIGAKDFYDGGKGFDTLQLTLTSDDLKLASVKADIDAFEAFLARKADSYSDDGRTFQFQSFDLDVRNFEALKIVEIGGNAAPVATADPFTTDEDTPVGGNVLANDTDVEDRRPALVSAVNGSAENVGRMITLDSGALLTVKADGSFIYDPSGKFESLGAGQSAPDSFTYVAADSLGALSDTATVSLTIEGVDDTPAAIRVAVVGGTQSIIDAARDQLNDEHSTAFDLNADAILVTAFTTELQWTGAFAGYDVVVIGDDGDAIFDYLGSQIFAALRGFVDTGHGVVTTGAFAKTLFAYDGDADYISPTTPFPGGEFLNVVSGSTITISDPLHLIAGGITDYLAQGYHEVAGAVDGTATVLATDSLGRTAIAYDEVGTGRTVFLGSVHMAADSPFRADLTRTADSPVDQIFERAVAWAAGALGGSGATVSGTSAMSLESNALPLGGDEPQPDDQFDFNNLQVTESHSSDAENIDLEFALAKVSNDSTETQTDVSEGAAAGWDCVDSDAFAVTVATTNVDLF